MPGLCQHLGSSMLPRFDSAIHVTHPHLSRIRASEVHPTNGLPPSFAVLGKHSRFHPLNCVHCSPICLEVPSLLCVSDWLAGLLLNPWNVAQSLVVSSYTSGGKWRVTAQHVCNNLIAISGGARHRSPPEGKQYPLSLVALSSLGRPRIVHPCEKFIRNAIQCIWRERDSHSTGV